MIRLIQLLLPFLFLTTLDSRSSFAQPKDKARNSVYFEILGNGFLYSLNYDRMLTTSLTGRIGSMVWYGKSGDDKATLVLMPVMINRLVEITGSHNLEIGAGPLVTYAAGYLSKESVKFGNLTIGPTKAPSDFATFGIGATATVGYRYQPADGGLVFRVGVTPLLYDKLTVSFGLSLGYCFF